MQAHRAVESMERIMNISLQLGHSNSHEIARRGRGRGPEVAGSCRLFHRNLILQGKLLGVVIRLFLVVYVTWLSSFSSSGLLSQVQS